MKTKIMHLKPGSFVFCSLILSILISLSSFMNVPFIHAQGIPAFVRKVRLLEADPGKLKRPAGLAYASGANAFQVIEAHQPGQTAPVDTDVISLTPFGHWAGSVRVTAALKDPINLAYDNQGRRMLLLRPDADQLLEVPEGSDGRPDSAKAVHYNVKRLGLQKPQGMTVDQASGDLFILDAVGPRIVRIEPAPGGSFDAAVFSAVDLQATGLADPRGLALDPGTGHLHVFNPAKQTLVELTPAGQIEAIRDLSVFNLDNPQGLVFAPSGDQTDDPAQMSLYLADNGLRTGKNGQIVELSFVEIAAPAASTFQSVLVRTTNMAALQPPSPDPSGITYIPARNTLLVSDGEVEETVSGITHFAGANVWELSLSGSVIRTTNISNRAPTSVPMTNEPTGVAWNPSNGHVYVSDDDAARVYDLNPGGDGLIGTADDTWTSFSTQSAGSSDPEGIAYDSWHNQLFVVDGTNAEVYQFSVTGSLISHFDVMAYGVGDPESVEFDPDSGTLFTMSSTAATKLIIETTTGGALLQTINYSAANPQAAAGLAYAPASDGSGLKRFYIVDRGIDNNNNPNIIDGKMYEMTTPPAITPGNMPPVVNAGPDQAITLPANAVLDGTVSDDGLPNPPGAVTTTWSKASGPGTVTFANASAIDTTASFSVSGSYQLCLMTSDGELVSSDCLYVTVSRADGTSIFEVRVAASSDDAEESASGSVTLTSSDIELVYDGSNQTVGVRFTGVTIPPQATISYAGIQFKVDETNTEATTLTIIGEASDNAATFTASSRNISSRAKTTASLGWTPAAWSTIGEAGPNQRTPDIASIVQEIVNRPGWSSGNALVIIISGTGHRTASAYDGDTAGAALLSVEYSTNPVNSPPTVAILTPASGAIFNQGDPITFTGSASDTQDGNVTPSLTWTSSLDGAIGTGGSFTRSNLSIGTHTITATASDSGGLAGSAQITLTVNPVSPDNQAPVVNAGPDQSITLPANAVLDGTVSDDGLPNPPGSMTTTWSMVSGPGTVTFINPSAIDTTASFSMAGSYVLRLTANDGALVTYDEAIITANSAPPVNQAPVVNAGPDQAIVLPANAVLDGTVSDDGLPNPPGAVTTGWSNVSGPGTVTFANASAIDTTASFSAAGSYVLRLTVNDSLLATSDDVTITVGTDLIFSDGFESGNLSAWSASVTDNGNLAVSAAAALVGTRGMQAVINDNNSIYVRDDLPNAEMRYRARFYFDPNSILMARNNAHFILRGYTANGTAILQIELRYNSGYQIRASLLNDGTSFTSTTWFTISDAPHFIELDWRAATSTTIHNGGLTLWIDGTQKANLTTVDNDIRRIDSARLGAVSGIDSGTRGTYYFDDFVSRRQSYIGQ